MRFIKPLSILFFFLASYLIGQDLSEDYIYEWKKFYPSKALKSGMRTAVFQYEEFSSEKISAWLKYNEDLLTKGSNQTANQIDFIDERLLRVQIQSEIDFWKTDSIHSSSLQLYSRLISDAIPTIFEMDFLLKPEKLDLIYKRLLAIDKLVINAKTNLKQIPRTDLEKGNIDLSNTITYLEYELLNELKLNGFSILNEDFADTLAETIQSVKSLNNDANDKFQKRTSTTKTILGKEAFDRKLRLYTDSDLTSVQLAKMALDEIMIVKELMAKVSKEYLQETYPNQSLSKSTLNNIKMALADMEKDAPLNGKEYLAFWEELADNALSFIKEHNIATLPKNNTLRIQTAPESAGAAARIGWVASAPPFDPNPITTLNLPSIPETLPKQEQIDFWASFNKPFNRMIVIHELYPGHYMQLKISRETPHPIRMLFPYGIYTEGWATFTEKVVLDAGWEKGNHLTLLAHLRKRLENANRSYTSVQVHCNNWNQEQVMKFSTETSLLAPQFAKSLWGRIERSPMQLTSYFLGGAQFTQLLKTEKERLGNNFNLKFFMDTIMKTGPIPIEEFYSIFKQINPN